MYTYINIYIYTHTQEERGAFHDKFKKKTKGNVPTNVVQFTSELSSSAATPRSARRLLHQCLYFCTIIFFLKKKEIEYL